MPGNPTIELPLTDRYAAGRLLADALGAYRSRTDVIALGLPRGGVPVAAEVARALGVGLDVMVVRKLGTPGQEELAMGAIASGGGRVLNEDVVAHLRIPRGEIEEAVERERAELARRERDYRGERPGPRLDGRCVILVDDGLATGATMRVAVRAARSAGAAAVVVAVPVAPPDTVARLGHEADDVVCLATPEPFMGVGRWYRDFAQISDREVRDLLLAAWADADG